MTGIESLAEEFEANRSRLLAVALRILGSPAEAEDAVQDAWLRLSGAEHDRVENLSGWLTTVVARLCFDMLRARKVRLVHYSLGDVDEEPSAPADPEEQALLADSVGLALLAVLESLSPAERLSFVLHDMFDVPFEEIGPIVGRSATAARQLASRGRRRAQGAKASEADESRKREVVTAFLAASRGGDFAALLRLLHPEAVVRADGTAAAMGAPAEVRGRELVATFFDGRAKAALFALIDGSPGAVWMQRGQPRVVFDFSLEDGLVRAIDLVADPELLSGLVVVRERSR